MGRPKGSKNKRTLYKEKATSFVASKERKSRMIDPTMDLRVNLGNVNLCASSLIQQVAKKSQSARLKDYELKNYAGVVKSCQDVFITFAKFLSELKEKRIPIDFDALEEQKELEELRDKPIDELIEATKETLISLEMLKSHE